VVKLTLKDEVEDRFRKLSAIALGLDLRELEEASAMFIGGKRRLPVKPNLVVDYLDLFEASLIASSLKKKGLRLDEAFTLIPEGEGSRFILVAKACREVEEAVSKLDKVRELGYAKPIALRILKEWRARSGRREGDVDEALHLAMEVMKAKEEALSKRCPRCGGAVARVVERARGEVFVVTIERTCCGYVERLKVPIKQPR